MGWFQSVGSSVMVSVCDGHPLVTLVSAFGQWDWSVLSARCTGHCLARSCDNTAQWPTNWLADGHHDARHVDWIRKVKRRPGKILQSRKAVSPYFANKQILHFGFALKNSWYDIFASGRCRADVCTGLLSGATFGAFRQAGGLGRRQSRAIWISDPCGLMDLGT